MSFIPSWFGGRHRGAFDPYAFDPFSIDPYACDPFQDFPFPSSSISASSFPQTFWENSAFVDPRIDWSETPEAHASSFPQTFWENPALVDTRIDWRETPETHVMKADLSGLKKEEVKVRIEDDRVLQICGQRKAELGGGKFMRSFRLPENAKVDRVKASMENGVLTVIIPKVWEKKPEIKAADISG